MLIKKTNSYDISQNEVTSEKLFLNRRKFLKLGTASLVGASAITSLNAVINKNEPIANYKKDVDAKNFKLNTYKQVSTYNNFFEFSTKKYKPAKMAHTLKTSPWNVKIGGLVNNPFTLSMEDIYAKYPLEEKIMRFRCVETWSMVVPWIGFSLANIIKKADPKTSAKYIRFETLVDKDSFIDQRRNPLIANLPYPYVEGLRLDEANNPLAFMAVGMYGKKMPNQNGAPIRLVVPWKYGFKSIKSIVSISFVDKMPVNTWQKLASKEYGFYANVNPKVDHPRWSQKKERLLGSIFKHKTLPFNGYAKEVAHLYKGMDLVKNF